MPNGGNVPPVGTTATTVIGLGGAGCRMVQAISDGVDRASPETFYNYVAIDSNPADLEQYAPAEATTVTLETPQEFFAVDRDEYDYLTEDIELTQGIGAARSRRVGRYYVDNPRSFDDVVETLDYKIGSEPIDEGHDPGGMHQVWILHALGGGTGSGAFPLVAALVRNIAVSTDREITIGGIGSLPRLERLEATSISPAGSPEHHVNAYAALGEIGVLLNCDETDDWGQEYPLSLSIEADADNLADGTLKLDERPLDAYGLLGMAEERMSYESHLQHKNQVVANTVLTFSEGDDLWSKNRRFAQAISGNSRRGALFSIDGHTLSVPTDDIERYLELDEEMAAIERQREELGWDLEAIAEDIRYITELCDWRPDKDDLPVEGEILREVRDRAQDSLQYAVGSRTIDGTISELESSADLPTDVDPEAVVTYVFARELHSQLEKETRGHGFPSLVNQMCDEYETAIRKEARGDVPDVDPLPKWEMLLEPALTERRKQIEEELEDLTFRILKKSLLETELQETVDDYNELEHFAEEYRSVQSTMSDAKERWRRARTTLQVRRDTLESRRDDKRDALEEHAARLDALDGEQEWLGEKLAERSLETGTLSVETPDRLEREMLKKADSLEDLVEAGHLDAEYLAKALKHTIEGLEEQVQDRRNQSVSSGSKSTVALLANDENHDLVKKLDDELPAGAIPISATLDQFDRVEEVTTETPLSIAAIALFTPIAFENTSEFGTLHEYYSDPDRALSEQFEGTITDEEVTSHFAYPELVGFHI